MIKFNLIASAFLGLGLLSSGVALASGSNSNVLKAEVTIVSTESSYVPSGNNDPTVSDLVFDVTQTRTLLNVTADYQGQFNTETKDEQTGVKAGTEYDRVTVKKYNEKTAELRFETRAESDEFAAPITSDVTVLGNIIAGNWTDYLEGKQVSIELDSRAQAKLERAFESNFSWGMRGAMQKAFPSAKVISSSATLNSQPITLSRKQLQTSGSGKVEFSMEIPNTSVVR